MLRREWRCSWGSADRWCSNYIWVINNFITYYITSLTVLIKESEVECTWQWLVWYFKFVLICFCLKISHTTVGSRNNPNHPVIVCFVDVQTPPPSPVGLITQLCAAKQEGADDMLMMSLFSLIVSSLPLSITKQPIFTDQIIIAMIGQQLNGLAIMTLSHLYFRWKQWVETVFSLIVRVSPCQWLSSISSLIRLS